jgi:hypothetical protein
MRSKNVTINGLILKTKANKLAKDLVSGAFKASNGFISRFVRRHNLSFEMKSGESESVNEETAQDWKNSVKGKIESYKPENVFNFDETALFWKLMQSKTYSLPEESSKGYKKSKDRVTAGLLANSDGTERHLVVIGKSKTPRCFKGIKNLPLYQYYYNSTAWMTEKIFTDLMIKLNKRFKSQNLKILLLLDNCSSHPELSLTNIELLFLFLPPNTTSRLQPLDAGIIRSFKQRYRNQMLDYIIEMIKPDEKCENFLKRINLLNAIHFMVSSLKSIPYSVFINCFKTCGIEFDSNTESKVTEEI